MTQGDAGDRSFAVPAGFAAEAAAAVEILRETVLEHGAMTADIRLVRPQGKGFEPGIATGAVLFVSGTAGAVLTQLGRKWVDEFLWPRLRAGIEKPSREFVDWLADKLGLPK